MTSMMAFITWSITLVVLIGFTVNVRSQQLALSISSKDLIVIVDEVQHFYVNVEAGIIIEKNVTITFVRQHPDLVDVVPSSIQLYSDGPQEFMMTVVGKRPGHLLIATNVTMNSVINEHQLFLRVKVANSGPLIVVSTVIGWLSFVAWTIDGYPQVYLNFKRRSVAGFNLDLVSLNFVGFTLYAIFNCGLYFIKPIREEYYNRYPRAVIPVFLNDVALPLHALTITIVISIQCLIFDRGGQRVSIVARTLLSGCGMATLVMVILSATNVVHWLDFLYFCSYEKLSISLVRFIPQVLMNYRRKSTAGFSIYAIMISTTGGLLSMLQMLLNGYNYDDFVLIFRDPTKFALGLFAVCVCAIYMFQHVLYRHSRDSKRDAENVYEKDVKMET